MSSYYLSLTWVPPANGDRPPWPVDDEMGRAYDYSEFVAGDAPAIGETLMINWPRGPFVDFHVTSVERQITTGPMNQRSMGDMVIVRARNQREDS